MRVKNIQIIFLLSIIMLICGIVLIQNRIVFNNDTLIYLFFLINGLVWICQLWKNLSKNPFSLKIMHWFFCLFFFFFAAITQYINNDFAWGVDLPNTTVLKTNICLTIWTLSVLTGELFTKNIKGFKGRAVKNFTNSNIKRFILTIVSFITVGYKLYVVGFTNLLSRSTAFSVSYFADGSINMMINGCFQATTFYALAISLFEFRRINSIDNLLYVIINSCLLLFGYFPFGLARYAMAVLYLGILLTCFDFLKKERNFILIFILAFTIILPLMNVWRFSSFSEASVGQLFKRIITDFSGVWLDNDYDAFTELGMSIEHIEKNGAGGFHLLSIALFWVPRSIWSTKALAGSHDVTIARNDVSFDNVSCSLPEEGVLDGGLIGVVLFGIFIGFIMNIIDNTYYEKNISMKIKKLRNFDLIYPIIVIFYFFLIRGDMLYTFPYLVSYLLVWRVISSDWIHDSIVKIKY